MAPNQTTDPQTELRSRRADAPMAEQHRLVWRALDDLAERQGLSTSGLAKLAGLDATSFNPSKRITRDGRLRWPSVETLTKVAEATGTGIREIVAGFDPTPEPARYLSLARVTEAGRIAPAAAEHAALAIDDPSAFFLDLDQDQGRVYRAGDRLLISPSTPVRPGDRAVAAVGAPENPAAMIGLARAADAASITLALFADGSECEIQRASCAWVGRILWASQ